MLTKFVMQDISEGEKKELVSLARKAGVNIQKIIQDVAEKTVTRQRLLGVQYPLIMLSV